MSITDITAIVLANVFCWAYTIYCLVLGREIKVRCNSGKTYAYNILFGVLGIILIIYKLNIYTIITILSLQLAATLISSIPSGYGEKGVYIHGRRYMFKKISEMNIILNENRYRLDIRIKGKTHFLFADKENKQVLEDIKDIFEGEHIL